MRTAIPTWMFAMVVVRLGRRFLVVREQKHGQGWYLPAGRVEAGETFVAAAERETMEEAGIPIVVEGLLRVVHRPAPDSARLRVFVVARPKDDTPPKTTPDEHSLGARWVTLEEAAALPLRAPEVLDVFRYVANGGAIHPLSALAGEDDPW
jgi:phosphatase NudJ